ncbi:MAG: 3-deoxy-manno-octulosonate cytidylyltransferase [Holosporaceae bacterium]|nr:3-deoxy-manno-octulosonate cytidylyltransferase [Holosporaceae bacterium]
MEVQVFSTAPNVNFTRENMFDDTLIVIPARIGSTRLPQKMLADIGGKPLIVHTFEKAIAANVGDVVVACDCGEIATQIRAAGGEAILTDPNLPSGTDRVFSAWTKYDLEGKYKFITNLQGDLPNIAPEFIRAAALSARNTEYDIFTLATPIIDDSYLRDSVVKSVVAFTTKDSGKALYFSRMAIPLGGPFFHHVGIYCFRVDKLRDFVNLPQGLLEKAERLEQLRALENNMTIGIRIIDADSPVSVDTSDDLALVRRYIGVCVRSSAG